MSPDQAGSDQTGSASAMPDGRPTTPRLPTCRPALTHRRNQPMELLVEPGEGLAHIPNCLAGPLLVLDQREPHVAIPTGAKSHPW